MSSFDVHPVTTQEDREQVFRLRYRVYVKERQVAQSYADHQRQRICEPLDPPAGIADINEGLLLGAFRGEELIGTLRLNRVGTKTAEYDSWYGFERFGLRPQDRATMTTKLCVRQDDRGSSALMRIAVEAYFRALRFGSTISFIDCNPPLLKLFRRLGFRQAMPSVDHPEYGTVHPMYLIMHDLDNLASVRSPFLVHQDDANPRHPSVAYFRNRILDFSDSCLTEISL